ncbi:MAG: RNA polymerase sigma factor FliA [Planctomycetes bacterium]|nr:RNA polymerase sigma factor FliA [Planctomycetota bacterium]
MSDVEKNDEGPTIRGATHTDDGRDLRKLWDKFRANGDVESRNTLTEFYFDMVRANADNIAKILVEAIEEGDLSQAGALAFFEAMNEFDPAQDSSFEEYGSIAIRRAIVEEIRGLVGTEATPEEME